MKLLSIGALIGAAIAYFFDPQSGARRRNTTRDRLVAQARRTGRRATRTGREVAAKAYGVRRRCST